MSQLGLDADNRTSGLIENNNITGSNNLIPKDKQEQYKEATSLKKMEEMKPSGNPKPESTLHKVGRWLSGIFGGILLAAGVAAATIATCGIAAGVAAAGIGLIATSVALRPKNPGASAPQQGGGNRIVNEPKIKNQIVDTSKVKTVSMKGMQKPANSPAEEANNIRKALYALEPGTLTSSPTEYMPTVCNAFTLNKKGEVTNIDAGPVKTLVDGALTRSNVFDTQQTRKNALLVRLTIFQYFALNPKKFPGVLKALNSPEGRQQCADVLQKMINSEKDVVERNKLSIFRAAIMETNLANPGEQLPPQELKA